MKHTLRLALVAFMAGPASASGAVAQNPPPSTDIYLVSSSIENGRVRLGTPLNITDREGYDNQPLFDPKGGTIFYTSYRDGQADVYRYGLRAGRSTRLTETPESEYSPTVMPDGRTLSVVRVEADSTQRLWQFDRLGLNPRVILEDVQPVGYHAWANPHTVALFVLGSPPTLQLADTRTGRARVIVANVGRSIHKVPGRDAISFVQRESETDAWVEEVDVSTGKTRRLIRLLEGNEFHAWTPDGHLIMGQGSRLYRWRPGTDASWQEIAELTRTGIREISRVAVSPDGRYLALVAARRE